MTKAFPPRRPGRGGWAALAIALGLWLLPAAHAQQDADSTKKSGATKGADGTKEKASADSKGDAKGKVEAKSDAKGKADAKAVPDDEDDAKAEAEAKAVTGTETIDGPDRWEDPRAEAAMPNTFPELPAVACTADEKNLIDKLAKGQGSMDNTAIDHYVRNRAAALTKHSNIKSLLDPAAKGGDPKVLETAARELMAPILVPANSGNKTFRDAYVKKLIEVFEKVWTGHLHSRTFAMIVLSRTGDPQALPVFAAQLSNQDQLAIVKLLAAVGISTVAQDGRRDVAELAAIPAARALAKFLKDEPDTFWPAQFRAVEALGALRVATVEPAGTKAEFAEPLAALAVNSKASPSVRAWSAWALGMLRIPNSVRTYNYALVANAIGTAAADIGSKIAEQPDTAQPKMVRLANLLVQVDYAMSGDPYARDSGLARARHPAATVAQSHIAEAEKLVRAVVKAGLEMSTSPRGQMKDNRARLLAANDALRAFVAKPLPGGRALFAGSAPLPEPGAPAVAGGRR